MIGKQQFPLGAVEFASGMASSDFASDGGLGTSSVSINPFVTPGTIKATVTPTDASTNIADTIIASAEDSQNVTSFNRVLVGDGGKYYSFNGSAITLKQSGAATTKYTFGFTDMASFSLNTYVTLTDNMAQWNTSSNTLDETWWTGTKAQSALNTSTPHPLIVFEGLLWIGDQSNLHTVSSGGTVTTNVLALDSTERIQALGIDPGTGLMMVSVQVTRNYSDTLSSKFYVYLYDGYSSKPRRKIVVDDLITAFYPMGGTVYIGYGTRIGYWNGSGVTFLRRLVNATLSGSDLPYRHHFAHVGQILLVIDGQNLLAYGETIAGKKTWYNVMQNPANASASIRFVANVGGTSLGIAMPTNKFYYFNLMDTSVGVGTLYFNNIYTPRPIFVRRIRVITTGITTTSAAGIGGVAYLDENTVTRQGAAALGTFTNVTGSTKYMFDFDFAYPPVMSVQPKITINTQAFSIAKVIIYYDVAE